VGVHGRVEIPRSPMIEDGEDEVRGFDGRSTLSTPG
jgi:hypothetical protein